MSVTLTLFCGPPGAGKTTVARRLEDEGRGIRIATDEWQARLGVPHTDGEFHERLQRALYEHALELLRAGVDVILEDGLWLPGERAEKFADARAAGALISWHVFDIPESELRRRLEKRNSDGAAEAYPVSRAELVRALELFTPPSEAELAAVDEVVVHRGRNAHDAIGQKCGDVHDDGDRSPASSVILHIDAVLHARDHGA